MELRVNKLTSAVKVLVVDDQPVIVDELCEFIESSGYRCVPCESSRQALQRFGEDTDIGLVLLDLHMPDMDGIELVQAMQKVAGRTRAFEAIMLTGRADKQDVIKALRAGISDYYQKPINLDELLEGLQRQEAALEQRQKDLQLGHLNQKLQHLSESINDLYQDLDRVRRSPSAGQAQDDEPVAKEAGPAHIPTIFTQLSPRQVDVARLVGKGQTNYQIACELGITEHRQAVRIPGAAPDPHAQPHPTGTGPGTEPSGNGPAGDGELVAAPTARRGPAHFLIEKLRNRVLVTVQPTLQGLLPFRGRGSLRRRRRRTSVDLQRQPVLRFGLLRG